MMRSLIGTMLGHSPVNVAPVAFAPRANRFSFLKGDLTDRAAAIETMAAVGTVFAIVSRTSNAVSQVNWRLYRKTTDGRRVLGPDTTRRQEVTRHLALDVWNKPNPFTTRQEFVEAFSQHVELTGEGWWVVGRAEGFGLSLPTELWCVRPDRMDPVKSVKDFIAGYVYTSPDNEKVPLATQDVVQIRVPNPADPYRGLGPIQSILTDIGSDELAAAWNANFFRNSAQPGGIIEVPNKLSDEEFDELSDRWRGSHQGTANAHRVAILENAKYTPNGYSMRDMEFTTLRGVTREIIREAFGFPKPMLGTVEDVNRANAEAAEVVFARWLVVPRLERIKQALNNDFLPLFGDTGDGVEFDYDNPVPDDRDADNNERTSKASAAKTLIDAGFSPEEVLLTVGLPAMSYVGRASAPEPQDGPTTG